MARIPMTLSKFEGHFCCYEWQNALRSHSASAELLVLAQHDTIELYLWWDCDICTDTRLLKASNKWSITPRRHGERLFSNSASDGEEKQGNVMTESVCLYLSAHLGNHMCKLYQVFCTFYVTCSRGSVPSGIVAMCYLFPVLWMAHACTWWPGISDAKGCILSDSPGQLTDQMATGQHRTGGGIWYLLYCFVMFVAGHLQTFVDQVSRAVIVAAVLAGKVCGEHGVATDRPLDAKLSAFTEELRPLQVTGAKIHNIQAKSNYV